MAKIRLKVLKNGQQQVYFGRSRATKEQKKEFFKDTIKAGKDLAQLSPEDRKLFGRVKGGIKTAATGERIKGQFVDQSFTRAAKRLKGLDLEALIKEQGAKNLNDLFDKLPGLEASLKDIMAGAKMPMWFELDRALLVIKDFPGDQITVNGSAVTKTQARRLLRAKSREITNHLDPFIQRIKITFSKGEMFIYLPEDVEAFDDLNEFNEAFADIYFLQGSEKQGKKK